MRKLHNTSGIETETVKTVCNWIASELGLSNFDVECRKSDSTVCGRAYSSGSGYHSSARPFVVLRIGSEKVTNWEAKTANNTYCGTHKKHVLRFGIPSKIEKARFPTRISLYQYRQHKGKKYVLANRIEALVYIAAHELRHLWQAARLTDRRKSNHLPMFPGSKGKFSEVDTEAYAIHTLRAFRKLSVKRTEKEQ